MVFLQRSQVLARHARSGAEPRALGIRVVRPVMQQVRFDVEVRTQLLHTRKYTIVVLKVAKIEVAAVAEADSVSARRLAHCAVVLGVGHDQIGLDGIRGLAEETRFRLRHLEVDLGALVDVACFGCFHARALERRIELHVREAVAVSLAPIDVQSSKKEGTHSGIVQTAYFA